MTDKPAGRLAAVTGKDVTIDAGDHYDGWADSYDDDLINTYGYCAPAIASEAFARFVPDRTASVIDVGCGTGLVAAELAKAGFGRIDGIDISTGMLAKAESTGFYRKLIHQDAGAPSVICGGSYDAVISVGSFGIGHLGPDALGSLVAMARPGGRVVIFMNAEPYVDEDYAGHIDQMQKDGIWQVDGIEDHNYMSELDRPGKLILARRKT